MRYQSIFKVIFCLNSLIFFEIRLHATEQKLFFLHIPKTGGVTVSSLLMNEYNFSQIIGPNPLLHAIGTHYSLYEVSKRTDIAGFSFITFMRNPIDRVLSEQSYIMENWNGSEIIKVAHRLPKDGEPVVTTENVVCKILSGLNDKDPSISIERHLEMAKKNIEQKFFFIGITEKMQESIFLLYSILGWEVPEKIPQYNMSYSRSLKYNCKILEEIAHRNWADIELYEYAITLYDINENQVLSGFYKDRLKQVEFKDLYSYTFDQRLNGYGWGLRYLLKNGDAYRWADNDNEASLNFYLKPDRDYVLEFDMLIQPILLESFEVLVEKQKIAVKFCRNGLVGSEYIWIKCKASIPSGSLSKEHKSNITFRMIPPNDPNLMEVYQSDNYEEMRNMHCIKGKFACKKVDIY